MCRSKLVDIDKTSLGTSFNLAKIRIYRKFCIKSLNENRSSITPHTMGSIFYLRPIREPSSETANQRLNMLINLRQNCRAENLTPWAAIKKSTHQARET